MKNNEKVDEQNFIQDELDFDVFNLTKIYKLSKILNRPNIN